MRSADRKCDHLLQRAILSRLPDKYQTTKKLKSTGPSQKLSPIAWQHIHFHGHYIFCGSRHPINLDAMVANLTLQEE
jgi:hypothetical protein